MIKKTTASSIIPKDADPRYHELLGRALCEMRQESPDTRVGHEVAGSGAFHFSPRWRLAANEMIEFRRKLKAIAQADHDYEITL